MSVEQVLCLPAVTSCYQVHAQNADTDIPICGAALLVQVPLVDCSGVASPKIWVVQKFFGGQNV